MPGKVAASWITSGGAALGPGPVGPRGRSAVGGADRIRGVDTRKRTWGASLTQIQRKSPAHDAGSFPSSRSFDVTDIDRLAMESSVDVLADLENLALKHEIRREAILRELERRREGRRQQRESPGRQKLNGRVRALGEGLADAPPSPCDRYLST
jgi:hypothetical protein